MKTFIFGIFSYLVTCAAYAAVAMKDAPADAPVPDTINVGGIVAFVVIFFGLCAYYGWYVWRQEKKRKEKEGK